SRPLAPPIRRGEHARNVVLGLESKRLRFLHVQGCPSRFAGAATSLTVNSRRIAFSRGRGDEPLITCRGLGELGTCTSSRFPGRRARCRAPPPTVAAPAVRLWRAPVLTGPTRTDALVAAAAFSASALARVDAV